MPTLTEKLTSLLPEEKKPGFYWRGASKLDNANVESYNEAVTESRNAVHEILKLIRERIAGLPPYIHPDIKEEIVVKREVLELLK